MNPWERLKSGKPSVFATDPAFTLNKRTNSSEKTNMDLGPLSESGKKGHLQRAQYRRNNPVVRPRSNGEIPQALRSTRVK